MQKLRREELLDECQTVAPGLSPREIVQQSSCFVFHKGRIWTFNDEVACSLPTRVKAEGAVKASYLIELLAEMKDETVDVEVTDSELVVRGKSEEAAVSLEKTVILPIDQVEPPKKWVKLDKEFEEAVKLVVQCASRDASQFALTCVHLAPEFVEACDNFQMIRHTLKTGVSGDVLIRQEALAPLASLDVTEVSQGEKWTHFRSKTGLVYSCRRHLEDYPDLSPFLKKAGEPITLHKSLAENMKRAGIFSKDNADFDQVKVQLKTDRIRVSSRGTYGRYHGVKRVSYKGPPVSFLIAPTLFAQLVEQHDDCRISEGKIHVSRDRFVYVAATEREDKAKEQ